MFTMKCIWAGQLVSSLEVEDDEAFKKAMDEFEAQLKSKSLLHTSCGSKFVLAELCIDKMQGNKLISIHNLKA